MRFPRILFIQPHFHDSFRFPNTFPIISFSWSLSTTITGCVERKSEKERLKKKKSWQKKKTGVTLVIRFSFFLIRVPPTLFSLLKCQMREYLSYILNTQNHTGLTATHTNRLRTGKKTWSGFIHYTSLLSLSNWITSAPYLGENVGFFYFFILFIFLF